MESPIILSNWKNITVSGRAASGATTLSKKLAERLGWKLINGGEMYREYVKKKGIPLAATTQSEDSYHIDLDIFIKEKITNESHLIVESWLSGFDAQHVQGVFKVFVQCSDDSVRVDRLVNRDMMSIEEAKHHLKQREEENLLKWEKLYHTRDFWNPSLYDLIIDTFTSGPFETVDLTLSALGYTKNG